MEKMENVCQKCNKTFSTKYTLKKHVCKSDVKSYIVCHSSNCDYKTTKKSDLSKHIKICKHIEIDKRCEDYEQKIKNINTEYQTMLEKVRQDYEKQIEYMKNEHTTLTSLLEKALMKPSYQG